MHREDAERRTDTAHFLAPRVACTTRPLSKAIAWYDMYRPHAATDHTDHPDVHAFHNWAARRYAGVTSPIRQWPRSYSMPSFICTARLAHRHQYPLIAINTLSSSCPRGSMPPSRAQPAQLFAPRSPRAPNPHALWIPDPDRSAFTAHLTATLMNTPRRRPQQRRQARTPRAAAASRGMCPRARLA